MMSFMSFSSLLLIYKDPLTPLPDRWTFHFSLLIKSVEVQNKLIKTAFYAQHNISKLEQKAETHYGFCSLLPSEFSLAQKDEQAHLRCVGADTKLISRLPGQQVDQIHTLSESEAEIKN